jgi:hypothetical protein
MHPDFPLYTREQLVAELPVLKANEAFFHAKAWEAIQAGDNEAASNYIDIHGDAELKADETEAHIMNFDFDNKQEWIRQHPLTVRTLGMVAVSASLGMSPETIMNLGGSENLKVHQHNKCGNLITHHLKPNFNKIDKD